MLNLIKQNVKFLYFSSKAIKNDREVVMEVVSQESAVTIGISGVGERYRFCYASCLPRFTIFRMFFHRVTKLQIQVVQAYFRNLYASSSGLDELQDYRHIIVESIKKEGLTIFDKQDQWVLDEEKFDLAKTSIQRDIVKASSIRSKKLDAVVFINTTGKKN